MAIIKITSGKINPKIIIDYVCNKEKTADKLISGKDCMPESAAGEFAQVKKHFGKTDGRTYYHMIQSFSPDDDITPEQAHEFGLMMADLFSGHQVLVATHTNKAHIHNHLVINSVDFETGKKLTISNQELEQIKEYSNQICLKYGWTVTEAKTRRNNKPHWKQEIINAALYAMSQSYDMDAFVEIMYMHGINVSYNPDYKYMTYTDSDGHKCRDSKLFDERLLKKNLELYFAMGGTDTIISEPILSYQTPKTGNCTDGLTNFIADFIGTIQVNPRSYDPYDDIIEDRILDEMLYKMRAHGIRITKAQLAHIRNSRYDQEQYEDEEQSFGLFM